MAGKAKAAAKDQSIAASWKRIEKALRAIKTKSKPELKKGAALERIAALETAIGQQLPEDVKESPSSALLTP